ncbi:MAG: DUF3082 domain-containing protein [Synechococcus sp.]
MTQLQQDTGFIKVSTGTIISGGMAYLFIRLLMSILHNLPPIAIDGSPLARSISIGVRYMLVGSIGLMAFMFSVVTIGLLAYSIQLAWLGLTSHTGSDSSDVVVADSSIGSPPNISEIVAVERGEDSTEQTSQPANSSNAAEDASTANAAG